MTALKRRKDGEAADFDRFLPHAKIIPMTGKSCRLRSSPNPGTATHKACKAKKETV